MAGHRGGNEGKARTEAGVDIKSDTASDARLARGAEPAALPPAGQPRFWNGWANDELSAYVVRLINDRGLNLDDVAVIATMLEKPDEAQIREILDYFRGIVQVLHGTPAAYEAALRFIVNNDAIRSIDDFDEVLELLQNLQGASRSGQSAGHQNYVRIHLVCLNILLSEHRYIYFPDLSKIIKDYCLSEKKENSLSRISFNIIKESSSYVCRYRHSRHHEAVPSDIKNSICYSLFELQHECGLLNTVRSISGDLFVEYLYRCVIRIIDSITVFGVYIISIEERRRLTLMEGILERSLIPAFTAVGMPEDQRPPLVREIALTLLGLKEGLPIVDEISPPVFPSVTPTEPLGQIPTAVHTTGQVASRPERVAQPMPTTAELKRDKKLYSQAFKDGRKEAKKRGQQFTIVDHLKAVWTPWLEAGVLTQPELLNRDPSAYNALTLWRDKEGNNLRDSLGYDIPSKSEVINRLAAEANRPGDRPAHVEWALRERAKQERKKSKNIG